MLCEYGCEQEAKYQFKNGKWCCSKSFSKCPMIRKKRSEYKYSLKKINTTKKCDYGCGKIARYQFKNGIYCCSKNQSQCPFIKLKIGKFHSEKSVSIETRKKISESLKGKPYLGRIYNRNGKNHPMYGKHHSDETKNKMSKSHIGQKAWNKGIPCSKKTKKLTSLKQKITIKQIKKRYPIFSKIEEMRYEPGKEKEKVIQVHCKNHNCQNSKEQGGWFTPTGNSIDNRIACLDRYGKGGSYLYCSEECKQECPLYRKRVESIIKQDKINAGIIKEDLYTSEEYQTFRQEVFNRNGYYCEYCDKKGTQVHHSRPQKLEPGFSLDPDFGIVCCEKCHYKYGHKDECSTGALAVKVCI